jgi:amino acid adenylation domain-containing protein
MTQDLTQSRMALLQKRLQGKKSNGTGQESIPRRAPSPYAPLSFAQQRLWFLDQFEPGSSAYNMPLALRLTGQLDRHALERALNWLVERHEPLRTTFVTSAGQPSQYIQPAHSVPLQVETLSLHNGDDPETAIRTWVQKQAYLPFDLATGPLARWVLLDVDETTHVLVLTIHHIIGDGWSISVIIKELLAAYTAFRLGHTPELAELPIQYADYAVWQRRRLEQEGVLAQQLEYWQSALAGAPPVLELPLDFARPAHQTFNGARVRHNIEADLTARLMAFCRDSNTTLFMTLLGAYYVLLYRYSGQSDIVVGTPIAGRMRPEVEGLIGLFVNTLALRTQLTPDMPFRELVKQVRDHALEAFQNQEVSFEKLIELLAPQRDLAHSPLFQVMFNLQNTPEPDLSAPGLNVSGFKYENPTSKFDLTLTAAEHEGKIITVLEYNRDLFRDSTIQRMAGHYQALLENIVTHPDMPISQLGLLTDEEERTLTGWSSDPRPYLAGMGMYTAIAEQMAQNPSHPAIQYGDMGWSYGQLEHRSAQIAHALQTAGVQPDSLVAVYMDRSPDMLATLLGIWRVGAAYLPLDPAYPVERLHYMVEDAGVVVGISQTSLHETVSDGTVQWLLADAIPADAPRQPKAVATLPSQRAYVIYTSGSTGKPKGVEIEQGGVLNFLYAMQDKLNLTPADKWLAVTTIAFDISVLELFLPLLMGATIELVDRNTAVDGPALATLLNTRGITFMQATPASWRLLMATGWQGSPSLTVLSGGEALPPDMAHRLATHNKVVWNLYGPTETTVWATAAQIAPDSAITIGSVLGNYHVYIVDGQNQPVPIGMPGELLIGGAGVARSYLNRPELTQERFIPDPFATDPAARLYRTGDLARWTETGQIEFLGRNDHQVKLRGYRIELGEIESVLAHHPAVREAVVVVRELAPDNPALVAYLLPAPGEHPTPEALRAHARAALPDYMVPTLYLWLTAYPLTPSGKVDRKALPAPLAIADEPAMDATDMGELSDLETTLIEIWSEVLRREIAVPTADFFALGGHSLLATQVMARVNQAFELNLPLRTLFEHPTLRGLATIIEETILAEIAALGDDEAAALLTQ